MEYAASEEKDMLIRRISRRGMAIGENLLEIFMERYGLPNLRQATEEQLQAFWEDCCQD